MKMKKSAAYCLGFLFMHSFNYASGGFTDGTLPMAETAIIVDGQIRDWDNYLLKSYPESGLSLGIVRNNEKVFWVLKGDFERHLRKLISGISIKVKSGKQSRTLTYSIEPSILRSMMGAPSANMRGGQMMSDRNKMEPGNESGDRIDRKRNSMGPLNATQFFSIGSFMITDENDDSYILPPNNQIVTTGSDEYGYWIEAGLPITFTQQKSFLFSKKDPSLKIEIEIGGRPADRSRMPTQDGLGGGMNGGMDGGPGGGGMPDGGMSGGGMSRGGSMPGNTGNNRRTANEAIRISETFSVPTY